MDWSEHFFYSPEIPNGLRWNRFASNNRLKPNTPAGSKRFDKGNYYYWVKVGHDNYANHRIIWEMFNGSIPDGMVIDHKDGNPSNNCLGNLRLSSYKENSYNSKKSKNNTSGHNGVHLKDNGRGSLYWCAQWIDISGKKRSKNFSISALGNEEAYNLAIAYRISIEEDLNRQGVKISERHGK